MSVSSRFEGLLFTPDALALFGEQNFVAAMLRFQASLARAQASVGLIPESAAQSIMGTCKVELFDVAKIVRESGGAGSIGMAVLKSLKETVGLFNKEAAGFVHYGSTPQDMVETALALVTREALDRVERDVHQIIAALLMLAEHHAATPVLARSLAQPVSVTSFGLKCMLWAAPLIRSLQRLQTTAANACSVQLGGLGGMREQMKGAGPQVVAHMATALNLQARPYACDTQRDEWVALGCEMALLVGSLGKMSADLSRMCQFEVNELERSSPDERAGGVSVMPSQAGKKDTTAACLVSLTAAQRVPQSMAALFAAMPQEHESAPGNWPALLAEWPTLVMSAHDSARSMAQALPGLQVNTQRMRVNLEAVRSQMPKDFSDEGLNPLLVQHAAELTHLQLVCQGQALVALYKPSVALPF